jgi:SAM-dependent methyltransferase
LPATHAAVTIGGMTSPAAISPDTALKARHRAMWASGDYPAMVETFLLPLGPRLVDASGVARGMRVLDVAAGTGNASIPAALRGADVVASDPTPELFVAGRARAQAAGASLDWVEADAEALPFESGSFDLVMSAIGVMFAPYHQVAADELVRVTRAGGTIGLLSWTPAGMLGALFRMMGPFAPPPPAGAQAPPLWGSEDHVRGLFGDRLEVTTQRREVLEVVAFERPRDYGELFKAFYGPTISIRAHAAANGREDEFDAAFDAFCEEWNLGSSEHARFEMEYLITVGTRA